MAAPSCSEDKVDPNVHNKRTGATLASHPHFAAAWAQKLCYFANSVACDETDPEFQRVVEVFVPKRLPLSDTPARAVVVSA